MLQHLLTDPEYGASLKAAGPSYTALDGDKVVACIGMVNIWQGRAQVWALIAKDAGRKFFYIHKMVERALRLHPCKRVETTVTSDFVEGHRWMTMLGFEREGCMRAYTPEGLDTDLYARVS